jgi:hypothetical protein
VDIGGVMEGEGRVGKGALPGEVQDLIAEFSRLLDEAGDEGSELDGSDVEEAAAGRPPSRAAGKKVTCMLRTVQVVCETVRSIAAALGISLPGRLFAGARLLSDALERVVFGQFQRRASEAGSRGVHLLLAKMMDAMPEGCETRFHLVGHSLGCHVVTAAAIGRAPGSLLLRKLQSLVLLQGQCRL